MEELLVCVSKCVSGLTLSWGDAAETRLGFRHLPPPAAARELMKVNTIYSTPRKPGAPH